MPKPTKLLYSFPNQIGAGRICNTAWEQAANLSKIGLEIHLLTGSIRRELPIPKHRVKKTLSIGNFRLPLKVIGRKTAFAIHDRATAQYLKSNHKSIDIVHSWPSASIRTIRTAKSLGIPVLIERPNAHTKYAYEAAAKESQIIGIALPGEHDHAYNQKTLDLEISEYAESDGLLCPSDFVARTHLEQGCPSEKIYRHHYGYNPNRFRNSSDKLAVNTESPTVLFAGACEPRKGLHYALQAWHESKLKDIGRFYICGTFVPRYREKIRHLLNHPSISYLGQRDDVPELMRSADAFILPSVEEGSALVTYEAMASGCLLVVSDATGAPCKSDVTGLIHEAQDTESLIKHLNQIIEAPDKCLEIRRKATYESKDLTWLNSAQKLQEIYRSVCRNPNLW